MYAKMVACRQTTKDSRCTSSMDDPGSPPVIWSDLAHRPRPPLFFVSGAPGSEKTSTVQHLVGHNKSGVVVMDMDELSVDGTVLGIRMQSPAAADQWPAYNAMWMRLIELIRRSGVAVLLCCPLLPSELADHQSVHDASWLHLDCTDLERSHRLSARGWDGGRIRSAVEDASRTRTEIAMSLMTDDLTPQHVAARIAAWAAL